jgi:TRAP-type transport system periplasmic protein
MRPASLSWAFLALVGVAALPVSTAQAQVKGELKIASLAPAGSSWAKILEAGGKEIEQKTNGRVKPKFFFSGQQGDERDVVRKMKVGQIDGSAITAVGLGLIRSDVRVLELPFLFKNDKEVDYVRERMAPDFEKQFAEAGYILLSWGDVGWTHLYSNIAIEKRADLAATKMWAWTDDPIVRAFFKRLGVNGVPLGVPDVLPSLQTGHIDACYASPLAAVALQWYKKVKFATSVPISYSIGALVVRKPVFEAMSAEDQKIVREAGLTMGKNLMAVVRADNERARKAMERQGVKFWPTPAALVTEFEKEAQAVWEELGGPGKLYSKELLAKVRQYIAEARK